MLHPIIYVRGYAMTEGERVPLPQIPRARG